MDSANRTTICRGEIQNSRSKVVRNGRFPFRERRRVAVARQHVRSRRLGDRSREAGRIERSRGTKAGMPPALFVSIPCQVKLLRANRIMANHNYGACRKRYNVVRVRINKLSPESAGVAKHSSSSSFTARTSQSAPARITATWPC